MLLKPRRCPLHPPTHPHRTALSRCRLLDRWIILGGARDIAEMFVPAMGALGRCGKAAAGRG